MEKQEDKETDKSAESRDGRERIKSTDDDEGTKRCYERVKSCCMEMICESNDEARVENVKKG